MISIGYGPSAMDIPMKGNEGGSEFKCMKEFDSYIESLEYHNYLYYDQSLR